MAREACRAGHETCLVAGSTALAVPEGVECTRVTSAREMLAAVMGKLREWSGGGEPVALVMTAAVADWRPAECAGEKLKKGAMDGVLRLVRNPDILLEIKRAADAGELDFPGGLVRVGFAAETGEPGAEAARKCAAKGLDMVVGNDVTQAGCGFGTETNQATLVRADGTVERLPMMGKDELARRIVQFAEMAAGNG